MPLLLICEYSILLQNLNQSRSLTNQCSSSRDFYIKNICLPSIITKVISRKRFQLRLLVFLELILIVSIWLHFGSVFIYSKLNHFEVCQSSKFTFRVAINFGGNIGSEKESKQSAHFLRKYLYCLEKLLTCVAVTVRTLYWVGDVPSVLHSELAVITPISAPNYCNIISRIVDSAL